MAQLADGDYYVVRKSVLLQQFDEDAEYWRSILVVQYEDDFANTILSESRVEFEGLIPKIPYIGGDESYTSSLVESVRCLALYRTMKKHGKSGEETGKLLYDAVLRRNDETQAPTPPSQKLTPEQLMGRRKRRAERSQQRQYAADYVFEFVAGDGPEFDYGVDFTECAAQKFYHAQGADEFLPFYCFLDYPYSKVFGLGLTRTMTLAEGHARCNPRFKSGGRTELEWPPIFLENKQKPSA